MLSEACGIFSILDSCLLGCLVSHDNSLQSNLSNTIALPLFYFWHAWESVLAQVRTPSLAKKSHDSPFLDFTPFLLGPS